MKTTQEIEDRIKYFQNQKEQVAQVSQLESSKSKLSEMIEIIAFLDKQIALLNWVLSK